MTYIILAAGKGTRLHPITMSTAKFLFKLDKKVTIIQRSVEQLRKFSPESRIIVVTGFMGETIKGCLSNVEFVANPFYEVTNSAASLWFARDELRRGDYVTIINADVVVDDALVREVVSVPHKEPLVLMDGSIRHDGDYNVRVCDGKVVVMSKELTDYDGEYAGITMLPPLSAGLFADGLETMVTVGRYNEWYENALVHMIFNDGFELFYKDISEYRWTEVDCVDDLLLARSISGDENE